MKESLIVTCGQKLIQSFVASPLQTLQTLCLATLQMLTWADTANAALNDTANAHMGRRCKRCAQRRCKCSHGQTLWMLCLQATTSAMADTANAAAERAAYELSAALDRCSGLEGENASLQDQLVQLVQLQLARRQGCDASGPAGAGGAAADKEFLTLLQQARRQGYNAAGPAGAATGAHMCSLSCGLKGCQEKAQLCMQTHLACVNAVLTHAHTVAQPLLRRVSRAIRKRHSFACKHIALVNAVLTHARTVAQPCCAGSQGPSGRGTATARA
eukprot:1161902-Pelagomonas_calceolata.AAC.13